MKLSTSQKIEKLNEACKGSMMISSEYNGWNIWARNLDTPIPWIDTDRITAPTFDAVVDKAFDFVFPLTVSKKK